jgi:hypothetical protein
MSAIEQSIETIRRVHKRLGTVQLAKLAELPYTTVNDCQGRDFVGPSVKTLMKLANAAERAEREVSSGPGEAA